MGTIINNGTIAQNSTGSFTDLHISGTVTLTGTGVLAMSDSPNNRIFATGSDSLTNDVNHTIQGSGQLGINNAGFGFTLTNNGTILANQSNALNIAPSGNTTNNGTFQANSGSLLFMNGTLTNYDPTTSTLTGGTYNAFSGTIQLSQANTGTGAVIATNAATILLDGSHGDDRGWQWQRYPAGLPRDQHGRGQLHHPERCEPDHGLDRGSATPAR